MKTYQVSYMSVFFFFNDTATTEIYTLSLHDALPISAGAGLVLPWWQTGRRWGSPGGSDPGGGGVEGWSASGGRAPDRKSTRLNSSHANISYAVFCLKKKSKNIQSLIAQLKVTLIHGN